MIQDQALVASKSKSKHFLVETEDKNLVEKRPTKADGDYMFGYMGHFTNPNWNPNWGRGNDYWMGRK